MLIRSISSIFCPTPCSSHEGNIKSLPDSGATAALKVFSGLAPSAVGGIIQRPTRGSLNVIGGLPTGVST